MLKRKASLNVTNLKPNVILKQHASLQQNETLNKTQEDYKNTSLTQKRKFNPNCKFNAKRKLKQNASLTQKCKFNTKMQNANLNKL